MDKPQLYKLAFGTTWEPILTHKFKLGYRLIAWRNKHHPDSQIMITFEGGPNSDDGWVRIDWYTVKKVWYATNEVSPEEEMRIAKEMLERARSLIFFSMSEEEPSANEG